MVYTPAIPLSGLPGWRMLEATYDRQLEAYSSSSQITNDKEYFQTKMASPLSLEEFVDDPRLRRITMTAYGLAGEEWKRGFVQKVLTESALDSSDFLNRLNSNEYSDFGEAFKPVDGQISLTETALLDISSKFETAAFAAAVGEVNDDMRLSLNFRDAIGSIADNSGEGVTNETIAFRILGNKPIRAVFETALGLSSDIASLDVERQAQIIEEQIQSRFGISDLSELSNTEHVDRVLRDYHSIQSINNPASNNSSGAVALTLLTGGLGTASSTNLFTTISS